MAVPLKEGARLGTRWFLVEEVSPVPVVSRCSTAKTCISLRPSCGTCCHSPDVTLAWEVLLDCTEPQLLVHTL